MKNFLPRLFERFKTGDKYSAKLILADDVRIKDISLGGILLETTRRLNINNKYRIQICGISDETISPMGLVVWASLKNTLKKMQDAVPIYHVALKFVKLNDEEKHYLEKLIMELD